MEERKSCERGKKKLNYAVGDCRLLYNGVKHSDPRSL